MYMGQISTPPSRRNELYEMKRVFPCLKMDLDLPYVIGTGIIMHLALLQA